MPLGQAFIKGRNYFISEPVVDYSDGCGGVNGWTTQICFPDSAKLGLRRIQGDRCQQNSQACLSPLEF